ncbi:MAG: hypothetical protein QM779_11850 [Propionicimonas sp.]|uniref:helix-turn-helix domain-containing protein n=1 Tax=Propionicimonas sp. TaxID=1955623 RepID=UPI003D11D954
MTRSTTTQHAPSAPTDDLELLDVPAIENLTGLPHDFVRKVVYGRYLPTVRVGRRVLVRRSDLVEWIAANTQPPRER